MIGRRLLEYAERELPAGQQLLARYVKQQVAASGHPLAGTLDYAADDRFLDPSLFAFFGDPDPPMTLEQVLCGSLTAGERVDAGVECVTRVDPLLDRILRRQSPDATTRAKPADLSALSRAFAGMRELAPTLHGCLLAGTRRIVLFEAVDGDSFVSPEAHGAVFLRPPPDADEVFYIEDLAHQGGHHLFTALSLDWGRLFSVDRDLPLAAVNGDASERRTIEVAFHGVFTHCLQCICLCTFLVADVFEGRRRHELLGRLSLAMKRVHLDLLDVRRRELYSDVGVELIRGFEETFDEVFRHAGELITGIDLTNQPYTFSYGRFAALNV